MRRLIVEEVGTPGACTDTRGIDQQPTTRRRTTVRTGMRKVRSNAAAARVLRKGREPATPASIEVQAENRHPSPRANRAATRYAVYGHPGVRAHRPSADPHRTDLPRRGEHRQRDVDPGMRTLQPLAPTRTEPQRSDKHPAETPKSMPARCPWRRSSQQNAANRNRPPNRNGRISQAPTTGSDSRGAPNPRLTPGRRVHILKQCSQPERQSYTQPGRHHEPVRHDRGTAKTLPRGLLPAVHTDASGKPRFLQPYSANRLPTRPAGGRVWAAAGPVPGRPCWRRTKAGAAYRRTAPCRPGAGRERKTRSHG